VLAVGLAHSHAAQAERRDLESLSSEFAFGQSPRLSWGHAFPSFPQTPPARKTLRPRSTSSNLRPARSSA
jgi:hypothetical protein